MANRARSMSTVQFINNTPRPGPKDLAKLGGGAKSLLGLIAFLPEQGWQTKVVVPGNGQITDEFAKLGVPHDVFPFEPVAASHPIESLRTVMHWRRLFKKARPALIHANSFEISRSFSLAAGSLGIPYITHVRFPVSPEDARWTLKSLPKPAAFIFNSHAMMKALWPSISESTPASRPYVAHNAVDLEEFFPAPWPDAPKLRIGIIANFSPFKRHGDFIRMAAEMVRARQDLEFWVVGEDMYKSGERAQIETLARDLGVAGFVRFLGHRSDIPDLIRQMHLVVVPSQFEPFGRVVIEAMACGRPVIGSNDGGIPEIITHGTTGYLVEVGDCAGFACHALRLLGDRALWQTISDASVREAHDRFSIHAHVKQIASVYDEVLSRRPSRPEDR